MSARGGARDRPRERLDTALVARGLAASRERARALILAGAVRVDGRAVSKPGAEIRPGQSLAVERPAETWVSRGGVKLAGALERLGLDVEGMNCLDVGASTGGFTDVLLRRGAARVTAVDVGRGLLDARLRADPRVRLLEGINARHLPASLLESPYDLVTCDLSFISLRLVLDAVLPAAEGGRLLALVKPQFEVGRGQVGKGGVVRDPRARAAAVATLVRELADRGWQVRGICRSPLRGPKGNVEIFVLAEDRGGAEAPAAALDLWRETIAREVDDDAS